MATIDELLVTIFNHPLTYLIVLGVLIIVIMRQLQAGRLKPEQKPDFGVRYRAKRTKDYLKQREKAFGFKPDKKTLLYYGHKSLGRILRTDDANITHRIRNNYGNITKTEQVQIEVITYRRLGFGAALKSFMGLGRLKILVDKKILEEGEDKLGRKRFNTVAIPSSAFFRERGGILFLSTDAGKQFIDEINADADYENAKGFVSDFPRRLSNLHPGHAAVADSMELEEQLEEKKRGSFISKFKRGG